MGTMDGKICVVTGSSSGIGLETARGLASMGATVILACRDAGKAEAARADIVATTGAGDRVKVMLLDLASFASVRAFAAELAKAYPRLDVLINNAGLSPMKPAKTADGLELTFGVNHVGPHLLTSELTPLLKASPAARVVFVSSSLQRSAKLDLDDPMFERRPFKALEAYGSSKLANVLDARLWAEKLTGTTVTVNAVHPGVVSTGLARDMPGVFKLFAKLFFTTPEKGARASLFVATDQSVATATGKYFIGHKEAPTNPLASDPTARAKLWTMTEKLIADRTPRAS